VSEPIQILPLIVSRRVDPLSFGRRELFVPQTLDRKLPCMQKPLPANSNWTIASVQLVMLHTNRPPSCLNEDTKRPFVTFVESMTNNELEVNLGLEPCQELRAPFSHPKEFYG